MRYKTIPVIFSLICAVAPFATGVAPTFAAVPAPTPAASASAVDVYSTIAPYVDRETQFVLRVDLAQIDFDALIATIDKWFTARLAANEFDVQSVRAARREFGKTLAILREKLEPGLTTVRDELGLKEAFVVVQKLDGDKPVGLAVLVPTPKAKRERAKSALSAFAGFVAEDALEFVDVPNGLANADSVDFYKTFEAAQNELLRDFLNETPNATVKAFFGKNPFKRTFRKALKLDDAAFEAKLAEFPTEVRAGMDAFDARFIGATASFDLNALSTSASIDFATPDAAETVRTGLARLADLGADKFAAQLEADGEFVAQTEAFNVPKLVEALVRGYLASSVPTREGKSLVVSATPETTTLTNPALAGTVAALTIPAVEGARAAVKRTNETNKFKLVALAALNYTDSQRGKLPAAWKADADGKPLQSWRVELLPYLGERELYEKIKRDEPWDSDWNRQFHSQAPDVFRLDGCGEGETRISVVVDPDSAFSGAERVGLAQVIDGTANTFAFVERRDPVCWLDPSGDLTLDQFADEVLGAVGKAEPKTIARLDGSVFQLAPPKPGTLDAETAKAILSAFVKIADGVQVEYAPNEIDFQFDAVQPSESK